MLSMPAPSFDISIDDSHTSRCCTGNHPMDQSFYSVSRRDLLKALSSGFGYVAFAGLSTFAADPGHDSKRPLASRPPHFRPRAKRVIFLCMHGAPSHVDTFDYKPRLAADSGNPTPSGRLAGPGSWALPGASASTARAATGSRRFPRASPAMPTIFASSRACKPTCRPTRKHTS